MALYVVTPFWNINDWMHMISLYIGTCRPGPIKAIRADRAGRVRPRLAGDGGPSWEVLAQDRC